MTYRNPLYSCSLFCSFFFWLDSLALELNQCNGGWAVILRETVCDQSSVMVMSNPRDQTFPTSELSTAALDKCHQGSEEPGLKPGLGS